MSGLVVKMPRFLFSATFISLRHLKQENPSVGMNVIFKIGFIAYIRFYIYTVRSERYFLVVVIHVVLRGLIRKFDMEPLKENGAIWSQ